jgi:ornithine cyclodeaminase/alanine dehydrogenase-like protein (mu-crystallin family)
MHESIDVMSDAFSQLSNGTLQMPVRMVSDFDDLSLLYKPAASKREGIIAVKLLTQTGSNRNRSLPIIQGIIVLADYVDGRFLALMDGASITALRTGAASGLATKWLSNKEAKVAAIFGAGVQGRTQLSAICAVRNIQKAYVFDPNKEAADAFIDEMQPQCSAKLVLGSSNQVLKEVDVICTATDSAKPLFELTDLKQGVHINAIGSFKPTMNEISPEVIAQALVYVDHAESALKESGDLINPLQSGAISQSHIVGEIGALINGQIPGRAHKDQNTLFKSVGVAVQDLAAAHAVYQKSTTNHLGQIIHL